jgi:hypothetical protein
MQKAQITHAVLSIVDRFNSAYLAITPPEKPA